MSRLDLQARQDIAQQESDESLMLAYGKGDARAFDRLYQRHKVMVYRYFIRHNLSTAVAEELCHDTWLKVIKARQGYQANALFRTFLFTIARRLLMDYSSKKSTQLEQPLAAEVEQVQTSNAWGEDRVKNQLLQQALIQQIARLPFEQREVFLLKQEAGFSIEQIATITYQHKEKVKSCWRYALKKIRTGLGAYVE